MANLFGEDILIQAQDPQNRALGPVFEVTVESVEEAKVRLVKNGCKIIKDEPDFPRCLHQRSLRLDLQPEELRFPSSDNTVKCLNF